MHSALGLGPSLGCSLSASVLLLKCELSPTCSHEMGALVLVVMTMVHITLQAARQRVPLEGWLPIQDRVRPS